MKFRGMLGNWSCGRMTETPEDIANLYSRARIEWTRYWDFSASRKQVRQQLGIMRAPLEWPSSQPPDDPERSSPPKTSVARTSPRKPSFRKSISRTPVFNLSRHPRYRRLKWNRRQPASQRAARNLEPIAGNHPGSRHALVCVALNLRAGAGAPGPVVVAAVRTAATHRRCILARWGRGKDLPGRHPGACPLRPRRARAASRNGCLRNLAFLLRLARIEAGGSAHFLPSRRFWRGLRRAGADAEPSRGWLPGRTSTSSHDPLLGASCCAMGAGPAASWSTWPQLTASG